MTLETCEIGNDRQLWERDFEHGYIRQRNTHSRVLDITGGQSFICAATITTTATNTTTTTTATMHEALYYHLILTAIIAI